MNKQANDQFVTTLRGIPISLISLLLLAISVGLGEVGARLLRDDYLRWYTAYFGVAFSTWTYVFFFNRRYRFDRRNQRLLLFLALSVIGFALASFVFEPQEKTVTLLGIILILSLPAIAELILNRPILRRTPP